MIWIQTQTVQSCENLRAQLDTYFQGPNGLVEIEFSIQGSSRWETTRIGRGCPSRSCQEYKTYANLSGKLFGFEFENIFSDFTWIDQRYSPNDPVAPAPPLRPRPPHRHCHPMDLLCED